MSLASLYPELLLCLSQYLGRNEHKNMRLTCKTFADIFALVVVNKVTIDTTKENFMETIDILSGRSSATNPPIHAIRKLTLAHRAYFTLHGRPMGVPEITDFDGFLKALSSLVYVKEVLWKLDGHDVELTSQMGTILSSYPELSSLDLCLNGCFSMPALRRFRNLETLSYRAHFSKKEMDMPKHTITQILEQSPGIVNFSLTLDGETVGYNAVEYIFGPFAASGLRLCLRDITLKYCNYPVLLLPHLQHLKVLTLLSVKWKCPLEARKPLDDFWRGMTDLHVQLEKIVVDHVPDALVGYLQHYHGLESFIYDTRNGQFLKVEKRRMFGTCGREFYCEGLPAHSSTLREVTIRTEFEDDWIWSPDIQTGLAKCSALKYLGIGVTYAQLEASSGAASAATSPRSPIHLLLDSITQQKPAVRELKIHCQLPVGPDYHVIENYHSILRSMWEMLQRSVTSYAPPTAITSLPKVYAKWKSHHRFSTFVASASQPGQPLSYKLER